MAGYSGNVLNQKDSADENDCPVGDYMKDANLNTDSFDEDHKVEAETGIIKKMPSTEQQKTLKTRLEINRQRAREIRKRKKLMVEEMQKQILFLSRENKRLKLESQMQREELTFLRETSQLLASSRNMSIAPPNIPAVAPNPQARFSEYDILKIINSIRNPNAGNTMTNAGNTTNADLSNISMYPEPSHDSFLNPSPVPSSLNGLDTFPFNFQR